MRDYQSLCVVGLGYIGLPTGVVFASKGLSVTGVDISEAAVESINRGKAHIVEPGLDEVLSDVVSRGMLVAQTSPKVADAFILALPTPFKGNNEPDLSYIEAGCRSIAPHLKAGDLVILESTSPVGTTEKISHWLADLRPDLGFPHQNDRDHAIHVAHCPERVLPGHILREVVENDRVIGGVSERCAQEAERLYRKIVTGEIHLCGARTAEMSKLAENAFRDVNIAFANELSIVCDGQDIDVWDLIALANKHPRVNILRPGPGVGGHCIAVDPWFIIAADRENTPLMQAARAVNDRKPQYIIEAAEQRLAGLADPKVACLGLAYKADVDDLRESPAVDIVMTLAQRNVAAITVVEPHVDALPKKLADAGVRLASLEDALADADLVLLLVDHKQFLAADLAPLTDRIIDTRGVL